ncbi:MAG TPA: hypothetical protein VJ875_16210 [Pyrinomonadaceae bacterium]|nr:hypothetical protein [Pyrinomonadaceae bacterium]
MAKEVHHRVFPIGVAILLVSLGSACALSQSATKGTVEQNTVSPSATQTSKIVAMSGQGDPNCPASASLIKVGPSKPPLTFYELKLRLVNRRSDPTWFLLRDDNPLESSGQFACYKDEKHCFSAMQWSENASQHAGRVIVICFLGRNSFRAVRVPPRAEVIMGHYIINTAEPVSDFDVWEVESLLVNGKTPLQDWLPYEVMSDRIVHISERPKQTSLDWDRTLKNYRQDYPNEKVEFVTANAIRKWLIPVTPSKQSQMLSK